MTTGHYATVPLPAAELRQRQRHGLRQEDQALDFFRAFPDKGFSRQDIERRFMWPTQTASRVLANLTARGALVKAGKTRSTFGRACHTWRLRPVVPEQGRLL